MSMIQDMCKKMKRSNIEQNLVTCDNRVHQRMKNTQRTQIIEDMLRCNEKFFLSDNHKPQRKPQRKSQRIYMNSINDAKKLLTDKVNNMIKLLSYYTDYPELNNIYNELKSPDYDPFKFKEYVIRIEEFIFESAKTEDILETYANNTSTLHNELKLLEDKFEMTNNIEVDNVKLLYEINNMKYKISVLKDEILNSNYTHVIVSNYTKIIWYYIKKYKWYDIYLNLKLDDYDSIYKIFLATLHNIPIIPINSDKSITGSYLIDKTQTDKYDTYRFIPVSLLIVEYYKSRDSLKLKHIEQIINKYQRMMKLNFRNVK